MVSQRLFALPCPLCGLHPGNPFCLGCIQDYLPEQRLRCVQCALALPAARVPNLCDFCRRHPRPFQSTLALADYVPPIDAMVLALKQQRRLDLARAFGLVMATRARLFWPQIRAPLIVAVPAAPLRMRERGYNPAAELARVLAAQTRWPLLSSYGLSREDRPIQHQLNRRQRLSNLRGAFHADGVPPGRSLILVDDVMTTGATLTELARTLLRVGADSVHNIIVARTP